MREVLGCECQEGVEVLENALAGWIPREEKREGEHTVISRVFEGGEGVIRGGREDRSRESGVWLPPDIEVDGEAGGELAMSAAL